jgi:hypothetical protein
MARDFPNSEILAVDNSPSMIETLHERLSAYPNVKVIQADVRSVDLPDGITTAIFVSINHEVKSIRFKDKDVIQTLRNVRNHLAKSGREIIRDGVKPPPETLFVQPLTDFAAERFLIFTKLFKDVRNIEWTTGMINPKNLSWQETDKSPTTGSLIRMDSADVNELLSKYHYKKENLPIEMKELFGVWTLEDYKKVISNLGFSVLHAETFLLDYLLKEHYSKNFKVFHLKNGVLSNAPYPPSTMLLVGEKN